MEERARRLTGWDHAAAWALGLGFVVLLMSTMGLGFVRDEGFYFNASEVYSGWFRELGANLEAGRLGASFEQASIDRYFHANREHPPLPKVLFGLSWLIFHEGLGWMSPSTAMRFPATLFAGALIGMVYLFGAEAFGRRVGLLGALATAFMPRPFFHAHLACFDYPVAAMWFAVSWAYWKSLRSGGWAWATGALFGVALGVKHNIFFLPAVLGLHALVARWRDVGLLPGRQLRLPSVPQAFVAMAVLGPLLWYALWPWHWFDTFNRIRWYFDFHLKHVHYFQYYFGQNLYKPPFPVEFPFVMSAVTMPELMVAGGPLGGVVLAVRAWRGRRQAGGGDARWTGLWLALGALVPFVIIAAPSTPIFGGIKHWMPAMPFVALLGAVAVDAGAAALGGWARERASARWGAGVGAWSERAAWVLLAGWVMAPAVAACIHSHGYGTAHYNTLIGGPRGAADAKMMRQFWGYSSVHSLPWVNATVGRGRGVFFQNTNFDAYKMYQAEGMLRRDVVYGRMPSSDFGMIHHQMAARSLEVEIWQTYGTRNPAFVADYDGVPVLSVYPNARLLCPKAPEAAWCGEVAAPAR